MLPLSFKTKNFFLISALFSRPVLRQYDNKMAVHICCSWLLFCWVTDRDWQKADTLFLTIPSLLARATSIRAVER